ncbi:MAG: glycosyltransferase family 2 protein [Candidatus Woesebacteria bacterium]|nr:MAG: glycosyltransferase family 2 protein [Candidatus Woesebacteria bacterium]
MIELSIIIVNFNTKKLTVDCIKSIRNSSPNVNYEIIVIDNASSDGSIDSLEKLKIRLIKNKENLGFAKANNQGIKISKGKYILLLNSDTLVKKDSLVSLVEFAKNTPDAGVIGSKLLNTDGTIQNSVFRFPTIWKSISHYWFKNNILNKYSPSTDIPTKVDAVVGAVFLITPKAFKKVGFLDERYFMYFEDIDYCRKIAASNLKVYYFPKSEIIHIHGASKAKNEYLIKASKIYHGVINYYIITFIIKISQLFDKITKDEKH